jgi:formylglycine-generating enzyme required for sulfatase activity
MQRFLQKVEIPLTEEEKHRRQHNHLKLFQGIFQLWAKTKALAPENQTKFFRIVAALIVLITTLTILTLTGQLNSIIYRPMRMEWVEIPEGAFLMGSLETVERVGNDEFPQHKVYLDFYKIGKYEVTYKQYLRCVKAGACAAPFSQSYTIKEYQNHPVTNINWFDAKTFCEWSGGRLPTEAEWEKAAHGSGSTNISWDEGIDYWQLHYGNFIVGDAEPVGSYPARASQYGALDMEGNVWEWVADWYSSGYYEVSPFKNPLGSPSGETRVVRGSWENVLRITRSANRANRPPDFHSYNLGFRCAQGKSSR